MPGGTKRRKEREGESNKRKTQRQRISMIHRSLSSNGYRHSPMNFTIGPCKRIDCYRVERENKTNSIESKLNNEKCKEAERTKVTLNVSKR